jgi:hypothetical protein
VKAHGKPEWFELGDLPLESFTLKRLLAAARARAGELALDYLPAFKQDGHRRHTALERAERIEQVALRAGSQQRLRGMLTVYINQLLAHLAEQGDGGRLTVDQRTRPSVGFDDSPQQQFAGVAGEVTLGEPGVEAGMALKACADISTRTGIANDASVAAGAQGQAKRIKQNGFARAGFPGEGGKACTELDVGRVDDDEIAQMQRQQHGLDSLGAT